MHRRSLAIIAAGTTLVALTAAAPAEDTSQAEATAVEIEGLAVIGGSSADSGGSASGTAVQVGDETVSGGSQEGDGASGGEIVGTGETEHGHASVGGWSAANDGDRSSGEASAARAETADGGIGVRALGSSTNADRQGARAESSALSIWLGEHHLTLLGAETSSDGDGDAYLVDLSGERLITSDDADGDCAVDLAPVARLNCLMAESFSGPVTGGGAGVVDLVVGPQEDGDPALAVDVLSADTAAAPDGDEPERDEPEGDEPTPAPSEDEEPAAVLDRELTPSADGTLPRTGGGLGLGLMGIASLLGGTYLRRRG